jgi:ATP-binding protein involved in chromosome partitioning
MFAKVNVPLVGVIENMSYLEIPGTNQRVNLYGEGGGAETAGALGTELLGQIPQDSTICRGGDAGKPIVATDPDSPIANLFRSIATDILQKLRRAE